MVFRFFLDSNHQTQPRQTNQIKKTKSYVIQQGSPYIVHY